MSQLFRIALPGIVALCWLISSVQAQTGSPMLSGRGPGQVTGFAPVVSRTQQIADSLQRLTQPGYYPALFAAQSQPNSVANARQTADVCNTYLCQAPAPVNTAPVATTNASQSAFSGNPFSYTANAFTDAETPGSLTYTASFSPANGLRFDPVTRVISGTPTATVPVSVTITATDPGGLSATTSFVIDVRACDGSCPAPDLVPLLYVSPGLVYGPSSVSVVAEVINVGSQATSAPITLRISRDPMLLLSLPPDATAVGPRPVQNGSWSLDSSDPDVYVLSTSQAIGVGSRLSVGLVGRLVVGNTRGQLSVSAVVAGSEGEVRLINNMDAETIDYFSK